MARNLLKIWPALWTFADHKHIEPTNNHAERALRGAVIYRKLSLGSQSHDGERRIERLLSAHTTCRLQRISSARAHRDAVECPKQARAALGSAAPRSRNSRGAATTGSCLVEF
jgi:hypothetical protein